MHQGVEAGALGFEVGVGWVWGWGSCLNALGRKLEGGRLTVVGSQWGCTEWGVYLRYLGCTSPCLDEGHVYFGDRCAEGGGGRAYDYVTTKRVYLAGRVGSAGGEHRRPVV